MATHGENVTHEQSAALRKTRLPHAAGEAPFQRRGTETYIVTKGIRAHAEPGQR
jgi:hypothetical protein